MDHQSNSLTISNAFRLDPSPYGSPAIEDTAAAAFHPTSPPVSRTELPLMPTICALVGKNARVTTLREGSRLVDGPALYRVEDNEFRSILHVSPAACPDVVAQGCEKARVFGERIGLAHASAILRPICEGRHEGRSFAMLPYRTPLSARLLVGRYQRWTITPALLTWLAGLAAQPANADDATVAAIYRANLHALADALDDTPSLRAEVDAGLAMLDRGEVAPQLVPMHGDLWKGNILGARNPDAYPFAIIDWRGSETNGFPIFDLVRLAQSYRIPKRQLRAELDRHAGILGCGFAATRVHLLAGLGHYAANPGEMPLTVLRRMTDRCLVAHRAASGGG